MIRKHLTALLLTSALTGLGAAAAVAAAPQPWMNASLDPDARADMVVHEMTQDEKLSLVFGLFSTNASWMKGATKHFEYPKDGLPYSAGFVYGIPRLGVPNQWETDAGVGVATQIPTPPDQPRFRTSLPSGLATAATWSPDTAFAGGAMIGNEARLSGFNVQLAGGVNLLREPRNGRNFEYGGEDPLLAGTIVGNEIKGIQSNHIISTLKHFAFNDQETNRNSVDVAIAEQAARQSDLLAFQIAYETGHPGSVMCSYNRVRGDYACESKWLLNDVLKGDWGFPGYVMSDWGATHSTIPAALNGLDQESGWAFDKSPYFADALKEAVNDGHVPEARLDDMAHRVLRSMFANSLFDTPVNGDQSASIDYAGHAKITQADAEDAIVLLTNSGVLPLAKTARTIAIIGGHADVGVLSGGGSSQVYPVGGLAVPDEWGKGFPGPMVYDPSSPMRALQARTSGQITYADGKDIKAAARLAAQSDIVIVFATQWTGEGIDSPLTLPGNQDALITAVAKANRKSVVVVESGGPVLMPWSKSVSAVVEAWYPGTSGGEAIARVLTGEVNPSGHLPVTFPASESQLPRLKIDGDSKDEGGQSHPHTSYDIEGAAVGYKWFDLKGLKPLFPFGHGLSYTTFATSSLSAAPVGKSVSVKFTVTNTGKTAGKTVTQVYVSPATPVTGAGTWEAPKRLGAFAKVSLSAGQSQAVTVNVDPRLLAVYQPASKTWAITAGDYIVMLGTSATDITATAKVHVDAQTLDVKGK